MYIHEQLKWPKLIWDAEKLSDLLARVSAIQGRLLGKMETIGFKIRTEATFAVLTQDILKTSEIEGEILDKEQVRSSLARRLGIDKEPIPFIDRHIEGIVEMMLDATQHYSHPLTRDRLLNWHRLLFPTHNIRFNRMIVGDWRSEASGPMQVVSGPIGREKVHYEAPGYERLENEMQRFLTWINEAEVNDILKSAVAHFWFVTIHPFEDGNGRIARAIADMLLARFENSPYRFYSMSMQIQRERKYYYRILEQSQKASLNITIWIQWYLDCLQRAIENSDQILDNILAKAQFWQAHANESFNDRQRRVLDRLFEPFEGKLTSSKWAKLTKCSMDTALRDINDLVARTILIKNEAGGRSTSYQLCRED